MRLVTYLHSDGPRAGAVVSSPEGDRVLGLTGTVEQILADEAMRTRARSEAAAARAHELPRLADASLLPPVQPTKILCLGYNYRGHVSDGADPKASDPEFPDVFVKTANVLIGPGDPVRLPAVPADVDYEGEIAVVIGRTAKNVPVESALDHVAGYTLFNDVTARDWQRRSSQFAVGKSFDTFGPLGPWVVTPDEIPDPYDLLVEVERDGIVTVSQSTSTMVFPIAFIVHYLSQVMTLEPGDIISTGTPQKLPEAQADHRSLAHGDSVTVRVGGIGELTTSFLGPHHGGRP